MQGEALDSDGGVVENQGFIQMAPATIIALSSGAPEEDWLHHRLEWLAAADNNDGRWGLDGSSFYAGRGDLSARAEGT